MYSLRKERIQRQNDPIPSGGSTISGIVNLVYQGFQWYLPFSLPSPSESYKFFPIRIFSSENTENESEVPGSESGYRSLIDVFSDPLHQKGSSSFTNSTRVSTSPVPTLNTSPRKRERRERKKDQVHKNHPKESQFLEDIHTHTLTFFSSPFSVKAPGSRVRERSSEVGRSEVESPRPLSTIHGTFRRYTHVP